MKNNCEIIRDLLPLYCDNVCSEASKKLVEEHIDECELCKAVYLNLSKNTDIQPFKANEEKNKAKVLKNIKKKIIIKRIVAVLVAVAITATAGLLAANKLLDYYPVEYYDGLVTTRDENNYRQIYFTGKKGDYANMRGTDAFITVNGEEKKIFCFYVCGNLYTKYFGNDKDEQRVFGVGKQFFNSSGGYYAIYYYPFDNPMLDENPDFEKDLEQNGKLLWKAEK